MWATQSVRVLQNQQENQYFSTKNLTLSVSLKLVNKKYKNDLRIRLHDNVVPRRYVTYIHGCSSTEIHDRNWASYCFTFTLYSYRYMHSSELDLELACYNTIDRNVSYFAAEYNVSISALPTPIEKCKIFKFY